MGRLYDPSVHEKAVPDTNAPDTVREEATEPPDWSMADIRTAGSLSGSRPLP